MSPRPVYFQFVFLSWVFNENFIIHLPCFTWPFSSQPCQLCPHRCDSQYTSIRIEILLVNDRYNLWYHIIVLTIQDPLHWGPITSSAVPHCSETKDSTNRWSWAFLAQQMLWVWALWIHLLRGTKISNYTIKQLSSSVPGTHWVSVGKYFTIHQLD